MTGLHQLAGLPDDQRRLRHELRQRRRVRQQGQRGRHGARLLDVHRRRLRTVGQRLGDRRRRERRGLHHRSDADDRLPDHPGRLDTTQNASASSAFVSKLDPDRRHARLLHLPQWRHERRQLRHRHRRRLHRRGVRLGHHVPDRLPDDRRRGRHDRRRPGRLRLQAQPGRQRAGLLDLPRRLEQRPDRPDRHQHRDRLGGRRLRDRADRVGRLPDHGGRVPDEPRRPRRTRS